MRFLRSTLRDSNTTVSLVDLTTVENAGVIRGLESGPGIKLRVVDADETKHITKQKKVIISFDGAPGVGENNTGANVGGGLPVFRDKTGTTLNFRTLTAGGAVELTTVGNTINISAKNITTLGQLSNDIGFVTASQFTGGGDVTVSVSGTEIRVSANAGGITSITETNLGAGAPIIFSISGTSDIRHRPIVGAGAVQISASPTQITISAAPNPTSLSQLTNDTGFITQTSANAAYAAIGSLSALSQLNNNQGFVSAAQFTGGGIVSVQVSGTGAGLEIKISANGALVTSTALGGGQSIITAVSAGRDIIQRTIVGAGAIQVSGGATEITISAAPNPTSLSQLTNDVGFITDVTTSSFAGGESVVFGASANEITFKTFTGGGVVSVTTLGNTINISANTGGGNTTVEQTALGGGEAVIVSISGTTDIQHRTITVNGAIQLSASPTELVLSAAPNPTLLSQLTNDAGYITETSALALIAAISASDVSALSQLTDDIGFITETSALALIAAISASDVSALSQLTDDIGVVTIDTATSVLSQLVNDAGYITETSALALIAAISASDVSALSQLTNDAGFISQVTEQPLGGGEAIIVSISAGRDIRHRTITVNGAIQLSASPTELVLSAAPNPTLLSELTDDIGFITETSALALIAAISASDVSALSQLTNDAGFVNQVSALGGGETVYIGTSANELQFKTFTGGGSVDVTTSGNTIKISAASGGGIAVQVSGVAEGNPSTLNFVATQSNHNLGRAVTIDGSATSTATINLYVPLQFSVRLNWSGTALDVGNEISELPPGWTYDVLSTTQLRINHNLGRVVRNFFWRGFQISGSFYQFTSPTTGGTLRTLLGSETTSFVLQITSTAVAGTVSNGHAYAEVTF